MHYGKATDNTFNEVLSAVFLFDVIEFNTETDQTNRWSTIVGYKLEISSGMK